MKITLGLVGAAMMAMGVATLITLGHGPTVVAAEQSRPAPKAADKAGGDDKAPLGSPAFYPSSARPVGWRGDGTGRYPAATPPTEWSRNDSGEKKNILWETKLPCYSWATPIIVGEKLFVRSEPYDLICLDKMTGKILWIRSHPPFVAVTDEEKKANPAFGEIEPLVAELQKVNDGFVAQGWTEALYKQKYDLQKKINELTAKADKKYKLPHDMWVESWSGYTGSTPCSDGAHVYFTSGVGVSGCYDLDGNLKWRHYGSLAEGWGEHGDGDSPALSGSAFIMSEGPAAYDKATGKPLWRSELDPKSAEWDREQLAAIPFRFNGTDWVVARGNVLRVSDGRSFHKLSWVFGAPVIHDDMLYSVHAGGTAYYYQLSPLPDGGLKGASLVNGEYAGVAFPHEDPAKRWDEHWVAAPLYHEGLLYTLSQWGWLVVVDTAARTPKDAIVYAKKAPFDRKNPQSRKSWGIGTVVSPALAGKYIYWMDNAGCMLVLEPGRELKVVAKNNIDHVMEKGWEEKHWNDHYHEVTMSTPIFEGGRIYIRGEQNVYCVGESQAVAPR